MTKLTLIGMVCLTAQAQTANPSFEVASIKPPTPLGPLGQRANRQGGPGMGDPVLYTCPILWLLSEAYNLKPYEYVGPEWVNEVRFDFDAKIPEGTSKEEFHKMLRSFLTERFKLAVHRERKEKGTSMAIVPGHARIRSDAQTMGWLAETLSGQMQTAVIDATALMAKYDFQLSWSYEQNNSAGGAPVDEYHPALMRALQSQLGLKVESKKGEVEVLVVDHLEKVPTEN